MIPIRIIAGKKFSKLSSSESVEAAVKLMEKEGIDYLLIEEEGKISEIVTSRELVGYPFSRLLLDCPIQPVATITEEALADEALKLLEREEVTFLAVLDADGIPTRIINRETIIDSLFQELEKLNREKDKYITELKQAEEALRQSRASFHNIVEKSADGIIVIDRDGVVHYINPVVEILFRHKAEELLGQLFGFPVVAGEMTEIDIICDVAETGVAEMRVVETEWEGETAYLALIRDITERKKSEETLAAERERLESIIASMSDGLVMLDKDNRVITINPALERMLGLRAEDVLGQPISGKSVDPQLQPLIALCHTDSPDETVSSGLLQRVLKVNASRVADSAGNYLGEVRVLHDVTREKELEQLKDDFIANVSHELRSPLHSIRGFVRLMLEGKVPDPETQREFLTVVDEQSQHLSNLVDDLLDTFAMESGRKAMKRQRVSIRDVVLSTVRKLGNLAAEKGINIDTELADTHPDVDGDEEALEQVVTNIIDNAIKFSHRGGQIIVKANGWEGKLLTQVIDHGIGISKETIPHLFSKFYQADGSMTRAAGGTGLGLYICKQIVEAHGGEMWVESKPGRGSTFSFTIPLASATMHQPAAMKSGGISHASEDSCH